MQLVIFCIFVLNLAWAVKNIKTEVEMVLAVYSRIDNPFSMYIRAPFNLGADICITLFASSALGFSGYFGSAMALMFSNFLSITFFIPKWEMKQCHLEYLRDLELRKQACR